MIRVLLMCWIFKEHFSGLADIWNVQGSMSMFLIPFVPKITFNLKTIFPFQSEYGSYPQFLTWLITWWLMKKMKKSKRRIQTAMFNFSSRFFVRIFISELKFTAFFQCMSSPSKFKAPSFPDGTCHHSFSFASNFAPSIWGQILQRNSESVCLAFSCGKRESRTSVFKPSQVHTRHGY